MSERNVSFSGLMSSTVYGQSCEFVDEGNQDQQSHRYSLPHHGDGKNVNQFWTGTAVNERGFADHISNMYGVASKRTSPVFLGEMNAASSSGTASSSSVIRCRVIQANPAYTQRISPIQMSNDLGSPESIRINKGNMPYSVLIAKAILSTPQRQMNVLQIYSWIVRNVPFFADKGRMPASRGWKNTIRHTLSKNPRFVRIPTKMRRRSLWTVRSDDLSSKEMPREMLSVANSSGYVRPHVFPGNVGNDEVINTLK
ncbi:forkhead box protein O-like [Exaiptasia diaphana]|uniref:Fork-head domain-containing protein n=1 Tax=Exaiptasia diaphana TaxID=2652724 RepID=A0A913Y7W7_EXADI|nr:forkhead box protein O-like [Exaiptasia diaphana]